FPNSKSIAGFQNLITDFCRTFQHKNINSVSFFIQTVFLTVTVIKISEVEPGILVNPDTIIIRIWRKNLLKRIYFRIFANSDLVVTRFNIHFIGNDPNLKKFHKFILVQVVLTVLDSGTGAHYLNLAFTDNGSGSHGVFMFQISFQWNRNNLHNAVRVRTEAHSRGYLVIIQNSE